MAQRTAKIIIDVDDRSLQDLNQEIKSLEQSMQSLKIGTEEWNAANAKLGELKTQFANATREATKLQGVVKDMTGAQQLKSVANLGAGMVGAFTAVSGSIRMLGIESQAFDEMTAKATTLMSIMSGLNQVSKLFTKDTMDGLKSVGRGFGNLVRTVKTSSTAMRSALIASGIGALVVAVGLLIANWDKLTKAVRRNREEKERSKEKERLEKEIKLQKDLIKIEEEKVDIQQKINNTQDKSEENAQLELDLAKRKLEILEDELKLQTMISEDTIKSNDKEIKLLEDKAKINERNAIQVERRDKKRAAFYRETNRQYEKDKAALKIDNELQQAKLELIEKQQEELREQSRVLEIQLKIQDAIDEINQKTEDLNNNLTILNSQKNKSQKIYETEVALINQQINLIKQNIELNGKLNKEDENRIKALEAQRKALYNQNEARKADLTLQIQLLEFDNLRTAAQIRYNNAVEIANIQRRIAINTEKNNNYIVDDRKTLIELINKGLEEGRSVQESIVNFDLQRNKILDDRLKRLYPSEAKVTTELFNKLQRFVDVYKDFGGLTLNIGDGLSVTVETVDDLGAAMESLSIQSRKELEAQAGLNKEYEKRSRDSKQIIDFATQQLTLTKITAQIQEQSLNAQLQSIQAQQKATQDLLNINIELRDELKVKVDEQIDYVDLLKIEAEELQGIVGKEEEYYEKLQLVDKAQQDLNGILQDFYGILDDIGAQEQEILDLDVKIKDVNYEIRENAALVATEQEKIANSLSEQFRLSTLLNEAMRKYAEEIQAAQAVIMQTMEMIAAFQDRKAANAQERIDDLKKQLDELDAKEKGRVSKLEKYQELLKDANGALYDELLQKIEEEKAAQLQSQVEIEAQRTEIEDKIKDEENKKLAAEARAAKWRKAQALVDAVIQGALAVIKSLPNVVLAALTGVLTAASIATIASQKTPQIPEGYAGGGFTTKGKPNEVAGVVHKSEYVAPAFVTQSSEAQSHIAALEKMRLRGYQSGGAVTADVNTGGGEFIDYDKMAEAFYNAVMKMPNPEVSVIKITRAQNEVRLTKKSAGL
jgi:hypothetical protein